MPRQVFVINISETNVFPSNSSIENYIVLSLQTVIVIKKDLTVLNVAMKMDSAPASQTFLARSVKNVLRDSMGFQTVKVGLTVNIDI